MGIISENHIKQHRLFAIVFREGMCVYIVTHQVKVTDLFLQIAAIKFPFCYYGAY